MMITSIPDGDDAFRRVLGRLDHQIGDGPSITASAERLGDVAGRARAAATVASGTGAVLDAAIAAILASVQFAPLEGIDNRYLAVAYTRELADANGYSFRPQIRLADLGGIDLRDLSGVQALRDRLARRVVLAETELPPPDLHQQGLVLTDPVAAFFGGAISHLPIETTRRLEAIAAVAQQRLLEIGVRTTVALRGSNPAYDGDPDPYDPRLGLADAVAVACSDCLIALHDRPSTGLGINVAHAQNGREFTIFLESTPLRSPNTAGIGYPFEVIPLDQWQRIEECDDAELGEIADAVSDQLVVVMTREMVRFEVHRRERVQRAQRYGAEHADVVVALATLTSSGRARLPIPEIRLAHLEASLDVYAIAPREEQDLLCEALGIEGPRVAPGRRGPLTRDEYAAAFESRRIFRYSDEELARLLDDVGRKVLAGTHRADLQDPDVWESLRRGRLG